MEALDLNRLGVEDRASFSTVNAIVQCSIFCSAALGCRLWVNLTSLIGLSIIFVVLHLKKQIRVNNHVDAFD